MAHFYTVSLSAINHLDAYSLLVQDPVQKTRIVEVAEYFRFINNVCPRSKGKLRAVAISAAMSISALFPYTLLRSATNDPMLPRPSEVLLAPLLRNYFYA